MSKLRLNGTTSGFTELSAPDTAGNNTFKLPSADGTSGQVLSTDGAGNLSWTTAGGGGGSSITQGNTSAEVIDTGSDGRFVVTTEGIERARIDSSGRLLVGADTSRSANLPLQITSDSTGAIEMLRGSASADSATSLILSRSRGTTASPSTVSSGDTLGYLIFNGYDSANYLPAARIEAKVGTGIGLDDMPGDLVFSTNGGITTVTERMRITNTGWIVNSTQYASDGYTDATFYIFDDRAGGHAGTFVNNSTSYAQANHGNLWSGCSRSATSAYVLFAGTSGSGSSLTYGADYEFRLYGDGNGKCDGSWTGGGADYAEMFEWVDGNPNTEDRRGVSVVLEGNKIRQAVAGEEPIGVISANPTILGDAAWNKWTEKHLRDDFGSYVLEEHNVIEWTDEKGKKHSYEDWSIPADVVVPNDAVTKTHDENGKRFTHRAINPAYDPDQEYVPREERPEWDAVGLMGKLRIRKGQVTGSRWIKMRDISDSVEEWLVR